MFLSIFKNIKEKENIFFIAGWISIAFFSYWGNISLGILFLLIYHMYNFKSHLKQKISSRIINLQKLEKILIYFLFWALFTSFFSYDKKIALLSVIGYSLIIFLLFFASKNLIKYKEFFCKILLPLSFIGLSFSSIYTIGLYFTQNITRSHTFFMRYNGTGTLMLIAAILSYAFFDHINNKKKYLLLILFILSISALLLTFSRGALVGFLSAFTFYNLKSKKHIFILIIIFILLFTIIFNYPVLKYRFKSIFSLEKNKNRLLIWESSLKIIKDHPLIGVGPGNYPVIYPEYKSKEISRTTFSFSHNIFSNMAVEIGLIGLILFSSIIFIIIKSGYKLAKINSLYRGLSSSFFGIIIREQFDCTILGLEIAALFWLLAGLIYYSYLKEYKEN